MEGREIASHLDASSMWWQGVLRRWVRGMGFDDGTVKCLRARWGLTVAEQG